MAHRTALIDGDTLLYESTTATEKGIDWGQEYGGIHTWHGYPEEAQEHFDGLVTKIREKGEADEVIIALSCRDPLRWRERIMPTYKGNRKGKRKPLLYWPLFDYCHENYTTVERPHLEGDDVLGILATHPSLSMLKHGTERVIVSIDKDLKTIPGKLYNYGKDEWNRISESEADYNHFFQALMGDTTDGYSGCPGVGKVTAEKVLSPFVNLDAPPFFDAKGAWAAIVATYKKKGLGEEVALLNARVARICRHTDYDLVKKEVVLWNAPK